MVLILTIIFGCCLKAFELFLSSLDAPVKPKVIETKPSNHSIRREEKINFPHWPEDWYTKCDCLSCSMEEHRKMIKDSNRLDGLFVYDDREYIVKGGEIESIRFNDYQ